jgi:hypothetical protein
MEHEQQEQQEQKIYIPPPEIRRIQTILLLQNYLIRLNEENDTDIFIRDFGCKDMYVQPVNKPHFNCCF